MKIPYPVVDNIGDIPIVSEESLEPGFVYLTTKPHDIASKIDGTDYIITATHHYKIVFNDYPRSPSREEMVAKLLSRALELLEKANLASSVESAMRMLEKNRRF